MTATLLVSPAELGGDRLEVSLAAYRHLFRARRLASGDLLRVVDGAGRARRGRVTEVGRRQASIALGESLPSGDPPHPVELLLPTIRPERASWAVEKCTEMGVRAIRFIATSRAPRRYGEGTLDRLRRVAAAALEQSGGAWLPEISGIHPWQDLGPRLFGRVAAYLDCEGAPLADLEPPPEIVVIGPEGGWSDDERSHLAGWSARPAGLGVRILRSETAAVVGCGVLLSGCRLPR